MSASTSDPVYPAKLARYEPVDITVTTDPTKAVITILWDDGTWDTAVQEDVFNVRKFPGSSRSGSTFTIKPPAGGWNQKFTPRVTETPAINTGAVPSTYNPSASWPLAGAPTATQRVDITGNGRDLQSGTGTFAPGPGGTDAVSAVHATPLKITTGAALTALSARNGFTFTLLVKWDGSAGNRVLLCCSAPFSGVASTLYVLGANNGVLYSYLDFSTDNTGPGTLDPNVWHFVSFRRYTDNTERVGINGLFRSFAARSVPTLPLSGLVFVVGDHEEAPDAAWRGAISQVAFYSTVLTDDQLNDLRRASVG